jgi:hypothetical protein
MSNEDQLRALIADIQANLNLISKTLGPTTANDLMTLRHNTDLRLRKIDVLRLSKTEEIL